jgi:hypothetical protein
MAAYATETSAAVFPLNVAGGPTYEYRDLEVCLDLRCPANASVGADQQVLQQYGRCVQAALKQVAGDGWEPDGSTDPETMWSAGRLEGRHEAGQLVFDAVTVPLKRPAVRSPELVSTGWPTRPEPGRTSWLTRIHDAFKQIVMVAVAVGYLLTLWGMYTEWGLVGVAAGIIAAPVVYVVVPIIGLVKYGALFLVLSNFVLPALCIAIAYSTDSEP